LSDICIIGGSGYVGLAYSVALADLGNHVIGLDLSADRVQLLNTGHSPIYEPGLEELLVRGLAAGRLTFTTDYDAAVPGSEFIFLCVGTPSLSDGVADMRQVLAAAAAIGRRLPVGRKTFVVTKSTMPIGSADLVTQLLTEHAAPGAEFHVITNPEFLREGSALQDILHPDRIVLGADDRVAAEAVAALYAASGAPVLYTDRRSAEMVKYAANAFLATKISFINEVAQVCDRLGADVTIVAKGLGLDPRIGPHYLEAGVGFGGSCLPKDVGALARMADASGLHPQLLRAVLDINIDTRRRFVAWAERLVDGLDGRTVAVWGLAYKQDTDDLRDSPALHVISMLHERGAAIRAYDPEAMNNAELVVPYVRMCASPYEAAEDADVVMVLTPWREFHHVDPDRVAVAMRGDLFMDGRNIYEPDLMRAAGLRYVAIGRPVNGAIATPRITRRDADLPLATS
jgi:UDPglucose 6-dehydrogenase